MRPLDEGLPVSEAERSGETAADGGGGLVSLAALALLVGAAAGLMAALFRLLLIEADGLRGRLVGWSVAQGPLGWLLVVGSVAAAAALAAFLVHRLSPQAAGSGIPHVEAAVRGELPQAPVTLVPVKFFGGLLAIGSGLALGREGPSVQMGASGAHAIGRFFRRSSLDCTALLAAGAGAGLATAFNAPFAGAIFVLEELVRRFDTRITIATLGASAGAIVVSRLLLGQAPDFSVAALPNSNLDSLPLFALLGLLVGLLGVAYNKAVLAALRFAGRLRLPVELRAGAVGAVVALVACLAPQLVGGGDPLTQQALAGQGTLALLALIFLNRFALGAISNATETPCGLFAPLLTLGATSGLAFGLLCHALLPDLAPHPVAFAMVGMAAFFTATIRAPVTGIILVIEMTGLSTQFLPMLAGCFLAMLVAERLRAEPIYDVLRRIAVAKAAERQAAIEAAGRS